MVQVPLGSPLSGALRLAAQRVSWAVPQFPLSPHPALVWPQRTVGFC